MKTRKDPVSEAVPHAKALSLREQNRLGRFEISDVAIETQKVEQRLFILFKSVIVLRCEADYAKRVLSYTALSHSFEPVKSGQEIPYYRFDFHWLGKDFKEGIGKWVKVPYFNPHIFGLADCITEL